VHLSRLILTHTSTRFSTGEVVATGLLFDMNRVFEDFVEASLREALERHGGRAVSQHRWSLDDADRVKLRPDVTWWERGKCLAVVDAKYKSLENRGLPNHDVYQLLAYCTAYGLPVGHLIYAAGNETERLHRVRNGGVQLEVHALDLERPPRELLLSMDALGGAIAARALA
jgi:5-methylcytosine-specific restriction enzyme subunit McrC